MLRLSHCFLRSYKMSVLQFSFYATVKTKVYLFLTYCLIFLIFKLGWGCTIFL